MYFEIYQEAAGLLSIPTGDWRWRLRSGNHEIIASGEGYRNKADCVYAVNLLKSTDANTPVRGL